LLVQVGVSGGSGSGGCGVKFESVSSRQWGERVNTSWQKLDLVGKQR